jgi:drug/metabolite transporter superfamily protein YnfA
LNGYRRTIFFGIVLIALGVIFSTILKDVNSAIGTVFIAIGGLFFIVGMNKKRKEDEAKK